MQELEAHVLADARALIEAGFDGIVVENFGDHPFYPDNVEPHTVAAMTLLATRIADLTRTLVPERPPVLGINVLRNDARAALAIAASTGARFIRVNVHTGAMVTDQGLIQGRAHETLRYRKMLGTNTVILADVLVKHAHPLGTADLEGTARDTVLRGGADAVIISGRGTGEPTDLARARRLREVLPTTAVIIGSGLTLEALDDAIRATDGAIVGTALKHGGDVSAPIDRARAAAFIHDRDRLRARRP